MLRVGPPNETKNLKHKMLARENRENSKGKYFTKLQFDQLPDLQEYHGIVRMPLKEGKALAPSNLTHEKRYRNNITKITWF